MYSCIQIIDSPMGTYCAPLVADLILFCCERDFMLSLPDNNPADVVEAFNSASRYLDVLLKIGNPYLKHGKSYIPQNLSLTRQTPLILNPPFWTSTCP